MNSFYCKLLFYITLLVSFCNANIIKDAIQDYEDTKIDNPNYDKVQNIERNIKFNEERYLDVYFKKEEIDMKKPVVIHFYGGIWYKGHKEKFNKIGSLLDENNYVAVLPNYGLFPKSGFRAMVHDVYTAIMWTYENIERYGGDPTRISLVGHSAGAHLIALTLFKSYLQMNNLTNDQLAPLPRLERVVFLGGPFNFDDFSLIKNYLGQEVNDSIFEQLVKVLSRTRTVSPTDVVANIPENSVTDGFNVEKFVFYYTCNDARVAESSALDLIKAMKHACGNNVNIEYVYEERPFGHSEIVNGIRLDDEVQKSIYLQLLNN
eukprot:jgi/Orpsp1_1/1179646/evm.model.c7180000070191.1